MGLLTARFKSVPSCKLGVVPRNLHPVYLPRRPLARVVMAGLLVVALLWTQGLGHWHRQVHSGLGHKVALGLVQAMAGHGTQPTAPPDKLFSDHQSNTDCQLFDQLSHADGLTPLLAIAVALPLLPQFLRASHGLAVARWHALFQARGPPSFR